MGAKSRELLYTVRIRVLLKYLGQLCLPVAILALVPAMLALSMGESGLAWRYAIVIAALAAIGLAAMRIPAPSDIQTNEAYSIIVLVFALIPGVMAFPLSYSGLTYLDAYCAAVSASTTTGLIFTGSEWSASLPFSMAWMQWYGGLGILVFSLALFLHPGPRTKHLAAVQMPKTDLLVNTRFYGRYILIYYAILTTMGFIVLLATGLPIETAVPFALGSVSTGGSALGGLTAAPLNLAQQTALAVFCLLGALPFTVIIRLSRLKHTEFLELPEIAAIIGLTATLAVVLGLCLMINDGFTLSEALRRGPLMAVFVQTTSGFTTLDPGRMSASTAAILTPFMLIGGGVGSTAGGIKGLRILIGLSVIRAALRKTGMPEHAHHKPTLMNRVISGELAYDALQITFLFLIAVGVSWIVFLLFGYDASDSLFLVVSAASNSGYSSGIDTFVLPAALKLLLVLVMILGRLELLAVLVFLSPGSWLGRRRDLK